MLGLLGFGKKRKVSKSVKVSKQPPAKLRKMCKKLKIKTTVKRGGKRMYRPVKVLVKLCKKKLRLLKKKVSKKSKKVSKKSPKKKMMEFGRRFRFGSSCGGGYEPKAMMFGASPKKISFFGENYGLSEFGKKRRRSTKKVSKAAAMKAFKAFYRRHCTSSMKYGGRNRFGNGGNPPLYASMGYEFCPLGSGGVLGANSTGLFPTPCHVLDMEQEARENAVLLPVRWGGGDKEPGMKPGKGSPTLGPGGTMKPPSLGPGGTMKPPSLGPGGKKKPAFGRKRKSRARKMAEFGRRRR